MIVFRSILVPIKAAVMNLLSIGAAYGVVVLVFQKGYGAGLIGVHESLPIVSFIPMFMFAILFGLSMDYEVFLLSRIREEYNDSHDNTESVIVGITTTARVITCAALIMVSVFISFVFGGEPTIKMFGIGLSTAVLVDATIIRLVLVPVDDEAARETPTGGSRSGSTGCCRTSTSRARHGCRLLSTRTTCSHSRGRSSPSEPLDPQLVEVRRVPAGSVAQAAARRSLSAAMPSAASGDPKRAVEIPSA